MILAQRVHLFPFRTQKLSSAEPKILAWRRAGKIGHCRHIYRETWVRRRHAVSVSLVYLLLLYSSLTHAGRFASKPHLTSWAGRKWTLGSSKFTIQYSSLAQSVEHLTFNQGVVGSSPTGGAISFNQKGNSQKGHKILWSFCYSKAVFLNILCMGTQNCLAFFQWNFFDLFRLELTTFSPFT